VRFLVRAGQGLARIIVTHGLLVAGFLPTLAIIILFWFSLPARLFSPSWSTVLLDHDGRLLSASIASDGQWRFPGDGEIPPRFVSALVTWEDKRFFRHPGIDPAALARALVSNIRARHVVSGGSTLTMQVIRLSRQGKPRTLVEKAIEAVLALRLEMRSSKAQILRLFASNAPFGGNVVGFEAASWRWFGREPGSLSWAECALLAVLPNSPGLVHPGRNREILLTKRNRLLATLHDDGFFDETTFRLALTEPLPPQPFPLPRLAPHLLDRTRAEQAASPAGSGARIRTTLEYGIQAGVNNLLLRQAGPWKMIGINSAAVLVLDVDTGAVRAYAGNIPVQGEEPQGAQVDVVTSPRSTGSLLKPFLYASLLDDGELLPDQIVSDIPTRIGSFVPENSSKTYSGAVPASVALARSLNVPAVRMLRSYGQERFYNVLKSLGMTTLFRPAQDYGLTLILGGAEGTLWDLTGMYAGLARSAKRLPGHGPGGAGAFFTPHYLAADKSALSGDNGSIGPGACWLALKALLEVERPGEEGAWRDYLGSRKIAWKTGTSYGNRDAWAIGVTPRYAVGVWVGNATGEGTPDLRGSFAAAPVLFDTFGLLSDSGWFSMPESDLVEVTVCARSGMRAGPNCENTRTVWAPPGAKNSEVCGFCRLVHLDSTGRYRASTLTEPMASLKAVRWFVLPPAMEWFYSRTHSDYKVLPPWKPGSEDPSERRVSPNMSLVFPEQGGRIYVPIDLDGKPGKTIFRATHRNIHATIFWHLDGEYLGETTEIHDMEARPGPGVHVLTLVDDRGEEYVRTFICLSEK
jgi:penicillin-binding protein 1C